MGPFFFKDEKGEAVTVDGSRYREMIRSFLMPAVGTLQNRELLWFQQDGATCHSAKETLKLLQETFEDRIISRGCDFPWPPRSPDLSPPDFFLWGYLKERVYLSKPRNVA